MSDDINKEKLIANMTENLPVLRAKLSLLQVQLERSASADKRL